MKKAAALALFTVLAACGGSSLSLTEYVESMQKATDELELRGEQFQTKVATAVDLETGAIVEVEVLQDLMGDTASALDVYFDELAALKAPSAIADAHNAFVEVAEPRLRQWQDAAEQANEIGSVDELVMLTLKSSAFTDKCVALEQAVSDNGLTLNLDCD